MTAAVTIAGTSTAFAQQKTEGSAVADQPTQVQPASQAAAQDQTPPREPPHLPEDVLRKMVDEQLAKGLPPKVGDVHLHGYFRVGFGASGDGGRQVCFQTPGW